MRNKIINFLKAHPFILSIFWSIAHILAKLACLFIPIRPNVMLFSSFGGKKYDDSPRAIYEEILKRPEFDGWTLIWAFVNPEEFDIPRGIKVKIDTPEFFKALLYSKVLVSNAGIDRNIRIERRGQIRVETWHGTPLKKILSDQNTGNLGNAKPPRKTDRKTIRCAQSPYDRQIFMRVFNASKRSFLPCGLPRNDILRNPSDELVKEARRRLGIPADKKVILYMPTYREYLKDKHNETYIAPPIHFDQWKSELSDEYVVLIRAHYAVSKSMNLAESDFLRDVSGYPKINDLYLVADILISDYSSAFVDYAITGKPMLCYAYDLDEYQEKRGLYVDLESFLPCSIDRTEQELLTHIRKMDYEEAKEKTKAFAKKYAPADGRASKKVTDEILKRLEGLCTIKQFISG